MKRYIHPVPSHLAISMKPFYFSPRQYACGRRRNLKQLQTQRNYAIDPTRKLNKLREKRKRGVRRARFSRGQRTFNFPLCFFLHLTIIPPPLPSLVVSPCAVATVSCARIWSMCLRNGTVGVYAVPCTASIQKLHLMVRAMCAMCAMSPTYGPWDHFPSGIYGQSKATRHRGSDSCGALGSSV